MKKVKLTILCLFFFCVGCGSPTPADDVIETAIANTMTAMPSPEITITPSVTPAPTKTITPTPTPTETSTPTPTITLTPTFSPTPTPDVRVISGAPEDYILVQEELPDKYVLRAGDSTPHLNKEILAARGIEDGKAYLEATGRLGGWIIYYDRYSDIPIAPEWIRSYIVMYETINGQIIANSPKYDKPYEDFEILKKDIELGDWNRIQVYKERQPNGKFIIYYAIEFSYRNVWAEIMGFGWESDVNHDYLENAARVVLKKLQEAPLVDPPSQD